MFSNATVILYMSCIITTGTFPCGISTGDWPKSFVSRELLLSILTLYSIKGLGICCVPVNRDSLLTEFLLMSFYTDL